MTDQRSANEIAIAQVERKIVAAKREAKGWQERGLPIPDYVTRKINNLKDAAIALRGGNGENR